MTRSLSLLALALTCVPMIATAATGNYAERPEGKALLELCGERVIEKTRYALEEQGARFEVDVFEGRNAGLVVAEIELRDPEQVFPRPNWLGEEVSEDARYRNSELSVHPYSEWSEESSARSGTEASSSS